jgi:BirA family biotin operon repressor/biotin-[acetyl-CoA-carboxylase] ligase
VTSGFAFLSHQERFRSVASTNDIVRAWLNDGTAEVCLAIADEQTAGRGRSGRSWQAPSGAALLLSLGFRPTYLASDRLWRLPGIVALAMADAAEAVAGLGEGRLRLKWPNDLVIEVPGDASGPGIRKLAGILTESEGAGTADQRVVVGIGLNADWPKAEFPAELANSMTSLSEIAAGRPIDSVSLVEAFLGRLEARLLALRDGHFDVAGWHARQVTTGRIVRLELPQGQTQIVRAASVDGASGALLVEEPGVPGSEREVLAGEVVHVRIEPAPGCAGFGPAAGVTP